MRGREHWSSTVGFVLAAAGSAIGLGNVWKFPYITGVYGGSAFVLWYLISVIVIGLPVILIEFALGRHTQLNPVGAFRRLAPEKPYWLIGAMGVMAGFIILSYYSVVAGWTLNYLFKAVITGFKEYHSPQVAGEAFKAYITHPVKPVVTHLIFMLLVILIVARGVRMGVEWINRILMPVMFFIILILVVRGLTLKGVSPERSAFQGLQFLFHFDLRQLNGRAMLTALGHAFFTLSLGMGAMLTYGSYLHEKENLLKSALWIAVADTLVALLSGVAIFTTVFALGFEPNKGVGLIFNVFPAIFSQMPSGEVVAVLFFLLLLIAALTSAISLMEVVTAYFVDERGWERKKTVWVWGTVIFLLGIPSSLSSGVLANLQFLGMNIFDFLDYLSFKYLLPLGGLLMVLFTLKRWKIASFLQELSRGGPNWSGKEKIFTALLVLSAIFVTATFVAGIWGIG
ncbi:MAG: sodium-dependent transporter [bacterium]